MSEKKFKNILNTNDSNILNMLNNNQSNRGSIFGKSSSKKMIGRKTTIDPRAVISSNSILTTIKNNERRKTTLNNKIENKILDKYKNISHNSYNNSPKKEIIISKPITIDERPITNKLKIKLNYKLIAVYKREQFYYSLKLNSTIKNLRELISKDIYLSSKDILLYYKDKIIEDISDHNTLEEYFNISKMKSIPIILVKRKLRIVNSTDNIYNFYNKCYDNRVQIANYPLMSNSNITSEDDLFNIVTNFCKDNVVNPDFICERVNNFNNVKKQTEIKTKTYNISFTSSDIAFDFNRYMNYLKLTKNAFKDLKITLHLKKPKKKINDEESAKSPHSKLNENKEGFEKILKKNKSSLSNQFRYAYASDTYITLEDIRKEEEKKSKLKWIDKRGFFTSVNKYSGIQI